MVHNSELDECVEAQVGEKYGSIPRIVDLLPPGRRTNRGKFRRTGINRGYCRPYD